MRERKTELLRVRLTEEEVETFTRHAAEAKLDLSAWVRRSLWETVRLEQALGGERRR